MRQADVDRAHPELGRPGGHRPGDLELGFAVGVGDEYRVVPDALDDAAGALLAGAQLGFGSYPLRDVLTFDEDAGDGPRSIADRLVDEVEDALFRRKPWGVQQTDRPRSATWRSPDA